VLESQWPDSPFAHDEYDANVFVLPASKNRNNSTMSRKSITAVPATSANPTKLAVVEMVGNQKHPTILQIF
jgi:hypothetical protein